MSKSQKKQRRQYKRVFKQMAKKDIDIMQARQKDLKRVNIALLCCVIVLIIALVGALVF